MPAAIEAMIQSMSGRSMADIECLSHTAIDILDHVERTLLEAQRSFAEAAAGLAAAGASDAAASRASTKAGAAIDAVVAARRNLCRYLESVGLRGLALPPREATRATYARPPETAASGRTLAQARDSYLDALRILLPEPVEREQSATVVKARDFCAALAIFATVLATLANLVTGPISLTMQKVARSLQKPLVATGMELSLAVAKEVAGGPLRAELTGQLSAQRVLDLVPLHAFPGPLELKIMAFALRLTGVAVCMASGRRATQCPCYPDLMADTGTGALDLA